MCAVRRAKPVYPQMASHPEDRLAFKRRAFTKVGVDCFGPIQTTVSRRTAKRWGVIFTCLTTRAIHLELAFSLSGESNRRGPPKVIRSDNGTNFVFAATRFQNRRARNPIWRFIPPAAPHQGSAWERLVGAVKKALEDMEMPRVLSDEALINYLSCAEALVNARPLTEIPNHPHEPALTPNHFLFGNANGETDEDGDTGTETTEQVYERLLDERQTNSDILKMFWERFIKEYLPLIAARPKRGEKRSRCEWGTSYSSVMTQDGSGEQSRRRLRTRNPAKFARSSSRVMPRTIDAPLPEWQRSG